MVALRLGAQASESALTLAIADARLTTGAVSLHFAAVISSSCQTTTAPSYGAVVVSNI